LEAKPFGEYTTDGRSLFLQTTSVYDDDKKFKYYVQSATDITRYRKAIELVNNLQHWALEDSEPQIAEKFADRLSVDLDLPRVRVYHFNILEGKFKGIASKGLTLTNGETFIDYPLDGEDKHAQMAFESGAPILLSSDELQKNTECFRFFDKKGVNYQIQVPCSSFGNQVALISADDKGRKSSLAIEDRNLLGLIGPAYGDAVATIRKRDEDNRRIIWYRLLEKVDQSIAEGKDVPDLLKSLAEGLKETLHASGGMVFLRNETSGLFVVQAVSESCSSLLGFTHDGRTGKVGDCITKKEFVIGNDIQNDPQYKKCLDFAESTNQQSIQSFLKKMQSMLLVPVKVRNDVVGVVAIYHDDRPTFTLSKVDKDFVQDMVRRVAITVTKLDEAQRVEAAMRQSAKLADFALLTTGVAHSIRNPMATLTATVHAAKLQLERFPTGDPSSQSDSQSDMRQLVLDTFREIEDESKRVLEFVQRLLRWAGPDGNRKQPVNVCQTLSELINLVESNFVNRKEVKLTFRTDGSDPSVLIGPEAIKVAILDLFVNAYKAIEESLSGEILVEVESSNKDVKITVQDNGKGMEQEQVDQFNRFDPLRPLPPGGNGLGLYLASKAIESGNGELTIDSQLGKGTKITVTLPRYSGA
jgi:signal transduction histidine kinase